MVDDHVRHQGVVGGQRGDVVPGAQPGVDLGMVHRVEAGVRTVERPVERQNVHPAEQAGERPVQQPMQARQVAAQAVGVGDQVTSSGGGARGSMGVAPLAVLGEHGRHASR